MSLGQWEQPPNSLGRPNGHGDYKMTVTLQPNFFKAVAYADNLSNYIFWAIHSDR